jgi:hypothetical protein
VHLTALDEIAVKNGSRSHISETREVTTWACSLVR